MKINKLNALLTGIVIATSATQSDAAIIRGINNGDGTWTVASITISFTPSSAVSNVTFSSFVQGADSTATGELFHRSDDVTAVNTFAIQNVSYETFGNIGVNDSVTGNNNFLVISAEQGETDWDTVIQFSFDDATGVTGDSIINVWHDDSPTNENILAGITDFSQLESLAVPEPSSFMLLGLATLGLLRRRK